MQAALQASSASSSAGIGPLAVHLVPLLSRLAVLLDLATLQTSHWAAHQQEGDAEAQLRVLLSHLGLPSPEDVLQGVLDHPGLKQLLRRWAADYCLLCLA